MDSHEPRPPAQSPGSNPAKVERRFVGAPAASAPETKPKREYKPDPAWDKLLLVVGAVAVVIALLVVPGILNRGGQNPIAEAAQATMDASGVRMTFNATIQGGPTTMTMQGNGVLNGEAQRASLGIGAAITGPETRNFRMQEIVDDHDTYIRAEGGGDLGIPSGWIRISGKGFDEIAGKSQSGGLLGGTSSTSPNELLDSLGADTSNVSELGRESIGGVSATHYTAEMDVQDYIDEIRDEDGDAAADYLEGLNPSATVDVWIGDDGLLRRMGVNLSFGQLINVRVSADFSDYGIHPQIALPPASQVHDASSLSL